MLKRLCLAFAGLFALVSIAQGAGTVPGFSLTPQFDLTGKLATGCKLYTIQAGTVSTPQNAYADSGLTQLLPNPMTCDAGGRLNQFFVADGNIKLRLTTSTGVNIFVGDNLLVVGPSGGGGGGGGSVDATTILATGDLKVRYGTGALSGFVRANGRTIGSATSGATERANADCQALFEYLWGADSNLAVSGGRGASANADWVANKTIALPDWRGRAIAALDDMGNSASGRLSSVYFGPSTTTLGSGGGVQFLLLSQNQLPNVSLSTSGSLTSTNTYFKSTVAPQVFTFSAGGSTGIIAVPNGATTGIDNVVVTGSLSTSSLNGGVAQAGVATLPPMMLATIYIKL